MSIKLEDIFKKDKTDYQIKLNHEAPWKSVQLLHGVILTRRWHPIDENETIEIYKPIRKFIDIECIPKIKEDPVIESKEKPVTIIDRSKMKKMELISLCVEKDLGITSILMKKTKADLIKLLEVGDIL
jgi:hypothetical protein